MNRREFTVAVLAMLGYSKHWQREVDNFSGADGVLGEKWTPREIESVSVRYDPRYIKSVSLRHVVQ